MTILALIVLAAGASALTFFSGFGLGTLLLPAFALFYPIELAVAATAVVHFLNGVFKLALVGRHANRRVVVAFGLPAILASFVGARALLALDERPAKVSIGVLLALFTLMELGPGTRRVAFSPAWLPVGGVLSGFFGGLSGLQGALRSAFLVRAGLSKEAFVGTGVVLACLVDVARLAQYLPVFSARHAELDFGLLAAAVLAAFAGAWAGNRFLTKVTLAGLQRFVGVMLLAMAAALIAGWL